MPALVIEYSDTDPTALEAGPIGWAAARLKDAAANCLATSNFASTTIVVELGVGPASSGIAASLDRELPSAADSLMIAALPRHGENTLLAWGSTTRGVVYALMELRDRCLNHHGSAHPLQQTSPLILSPKAALRSISKCFCSEIDDKAWFHDREGWRQYLDMLVSHRFSRLALTFGMPYNYPYLNGYLTDVYFHFAYPYLVKTPGHDVKVRELSDDERDDNLEALKFIGRECERRGLEFHLGLWTHGYDFADTPQANYTVEGISDDNHAEYCRDALYTLLSAVPQIRGVTFRAHIEGGIAEASYDFWATVFSGMARTGRPVEVDLHAKGVDPKLINIAIDSGLPVNISPKYLAEHMGLPYHQAAIRQHEMPPEHEVPSAMSFSEGSRRFVRYSYGDLLASDRNYTVSFRIWPGTQRILLWGDPALAGGYGQLSTIEGAIGVEMCEPLSYNGRMGSGIPGGRHNYTQHALIQKYDWMKYELTYRIWGQRLHDANSPEEGWTRYLQRRCGSAASACNTALTSVGGILNIVTQTHAPSACNHTYNPEIYDNLSLLYPPSRLPYGSDFAQPGRFGTAPTFDPQLFSTAAELARDIMANTRSDRYSPLDVADWLDQRAQRTRDAIAEALASDCRQWAEVRRITIDATILSGLAEFFSNKYRAACAWELYLLSGHKPFYSEAYQYYKDAIEHWRQAALVAARVYRDNLAYGPQSWLQGCWLSRLPAMERDLNDLEAWQVDCPIADKGDTAAAERGMQALHHWQNTLIAPVAPTSPLRFTPGRAHTVTLPPLPDCDAIPTLHYRRVNQAESWCSVPMSATETGFEAQVPADYTDSVFSLQYYFSSTANDIPVLLPGLNHDLSNQPYYTAQPDTPVCNTRVS